MKSFSKELLKQLTDNNTIEKALNIYKSGFIKEIIIDPFYKNEVNSEDLIKAEGKISDENGFVFQNDYKSSFVFTVENGHFRIGRLYCNCTKFLNGKTTCEHLAAIIKQTVDEFVCGDNDEEVLKSKNIFIKEPPSANIDELIKLFPNNAVNCRLVPIELEVIFEYFSHRYTLESYLSVSFLIGVEGEKKYKITNIPKFIEAKLERGKFQFGKNLTYDENIHYFNEQDEKIIEFIQDTYNLLNDSKPAYSYGHIKWTDVHSKNALFLKGDNLIKFLKIFENKRISLNIGESKKHPKILFRDLPLNFFIEKIEDSYYVRLTESFMLLDKNNRVFFYDENIYILSKSQSKVLKALLFPMSQGEPSFRVKKEDRKKFLNKVFPQISSNFNTKTSGMDDEIIKEELIMKSFLDKNKDGIEISLQYNYGENTINPLSKDESEIFILRDTISEKSVEDELILLGFSIDEKNEVYTLNNPEKIYQFIEYGLSSLFEKTEVFYSEDFKKIKLYKNVNISSYVKINKENLIDIDFSLDGISSDEIANILKSLKEEKKYHRLKDGSILNIESDELKEFSTMLDSLDISAKDLNKGSAILDKAKALYLDSRIENSKNNFFKKSDAFKKFIDDINDLKSKDFNISESMKGILRNYQQVGCRWLCAMHSIGLGGILADEMGLGKTVQSIAFMECCKDLDSNFLIICPSSVVYNWKSEIERFSKDLSVLIIDGVKSKREQLIESIRDYDVIITSYPIMRNDYVLYEDICFNSIIIDEAQNIKNHNSQNAFSVKNLNSKSKFALTGTPLENSLGELWSIFDFILPSYLGKYISFKNKYEIPIVTDKKEDVLNDLVAKINPFMTRRLKKDVITELPEKIESNFIVELSKDQKTLYAAYVRSIRNEIDDTIKQVGIRKSQIKILAGLTRLRQLCCDPSTFISDYNGENNKMEALIDLIEDNIGSDHKILVFSQFTTVLKNISLRLSENKISHKYLDGSTKSSERLQLVNDFNNGSDKVFLISLKAGGTGLNLTGADVVIHYDPWWNPSVENQATDRAHRIGQQNTVQVVKIIAKDTIEEKILKLQEQKKDMIENILTKGLTEGKMLSSLSEDEIRELFAV